MVIFKKNFCPSIWIVYNLLSLFDILFYLMIFYPTLQFFRLLFFRIFVQVYESIETLLSGAKYLYL